MRMLSTQASKETFGGIDFAILFLATILIAYAFGIQRPDFVRVGFDQDSCHHRVIKMHLPGLIAAAQTGRTVEGLGMKVVSTVEGGDIKGLGLVCICQSTLAVISPASGSHEFKEDEQKPSNGVAVSDINNVTQLALKRELFYAKNGFEVGSSTSLFHGDLKL